MKNNNQNKILLPFVLIALFISVIYSNTLNSSWHFDDYDNITQNSKLHIENLKFDSIVQTLFAMPGGNNDNPKLYRPTACFTFGINWYFGKDDVRGYHVFNITIHILTSFVLFLLITKLLSTPALKKRYKGNKYFVALLATMLWAINPIQVQAVTYIVQRMASLAAFFYVLGLFFYVCGRSAPNLKGLIYYLMVVVSFLLALGSKENAITLPIAVILIEIIFYQKIESLKKKQILLILAFVCILFTFTSGVFLFLKEGPLQFLDGYSNRSFTFIERILTEPRILMGYITKIFYPITSRISLEHDITVSTSILKPFTTLLSIVGILGSVGFSLITLKKHPILSFAILFFFLNHIIESSVIPLELIFDHRNYLPSFFLFLPVAVGLEKIIVLYENKKKLIYIMIVFFVPLLMMCLGFGTYVWNMAWATEKTLWEDAAEKAPNSARPIQNLASSYYSKIGDFDKSIELYQKSLTLKDPKPEYSKFVALKNIAGLYYKKGEYETALNYAIRAIHIDPSNINIRFKKILILVQQGDLVNAQKDIDNLLSQYENDEDYLLMKGRLLLMQGKNEASVKYFRKALSAFPYNYETSLYLGVALSRCGEYAKADIFLNNAHSLSPRDIKAFLALLENSYRAEDGHKIDIYASDLISQFTISQIQATLKNIDKDNLEVPLSQSILLGVISDKLNQTAEKIIGDS